MINENNNNKPEIVGVGWLSDDKSYVKLRINLANGPLELIMKKSKLTEKTSASQADYLLYPKPETRDPTINF